MQERRWLYLVVLTILLGFAWPGGHVWPADRLVELLLIGLVAYVVFRQPAVREVLTRLPTRLRVLTLGIALAIYGGHVLGGSGRAFPFIPWMMYTQAPQGPVRVYAFTGTTRSGATVEFVPTAREPRLRTSLVSFGLHEQADQVTRDSLRGRPPTEFARLRATLLAMARQHEQEITRIRVTQITLPPDTYTLEAAERRVVWEFEVP